ncbi:MAG: class I SAM-dependent methyltransferase [Candidatus Eisenbacteria bacterium]|uniref:Class I SAM-dependent methyltransferase n=1 Tax=Eiseniibacteriota bacterium TaxID=2212470 RepID=A0A948RX09_UNCEI|nr:class I SAM-dependent methyltransferase [Candidatus Eisenbacteria bacterium]MBU1950849.1 class I SAM-dependent methyltransferase [Candidatus Eisenbacteria bacterium]MBU2692415.1 class I SAM-dependent methyltransferase [Candidatus Eisenbacteria bacterium]
MAGEKGFQVTGVDLSDIAIEEAKEKVEQNNLKYVLMVDDFLEWKTCREKFAFVFDRGRYHTFDFREERMRFVRNISKCLKIIGIWMSIIGNANQKRIEPGPRRRSATEVIEAAEPHLEILSLTSEYFGSNGKDPARAWIALFKRG